MKRAGRLQSLGACLACAVVCACTIDEVQAAPPRQLTLRLQMAPDYVIGLPFFVEVTLSNDTAGSEYYDLLTCDPESPPFPVEVTCTGGGKAVTLPAESSSGRERHTRGHAERRHGFDLVPGEARTFVLDLSELEPRLKPGAWSCRARWVMAHERPLSKTVPVTLTAAARGDVPLVARLRSAGNPMTPSWTNLIKTRAAPDAEVMRGLSAQARRALVPYLVVREAVQGPQPLATFPLDGLTADAAKGPWASEASVLAYELRWARRAPDLAEQRAALLKRWPGLQFRVKEIEAGFGQLTTLRKEYGAERSDR